MLPAPIAIVDEVGILRFVNAAWKQLADENACPYPNGGLSAGYLSVCKALLGADDDTYGEIAACFTAVLSGASSSISLDYPCHTPQHRRWRQMIVSALDPEKRNGAVILHMDISERKQAMESMRHVMAGTKCLLWYATVEELPDKTISWDLHPIDEEAAQRCLPLDLAPGQSYTDAWEQARLPEDKERIDRDALQAITAGKDYSQEFRCRRRDGQIRWLSEEVRVEAIGEKSWQLVGVCTDVTERKWIDAGLRQIMAGAHCLLWYSSATLQPNGLLRYETHMADEAAAQRFFPVDIPPGKTYIEAWYEARLEEDKKTTNLYGRRETIAGRGYSQEFRCRARDGTIRWLSEEVQVEPTGEKSWRLVCVCTDITEHKRAAELIEWHAYHDALTELPNRALFQDRVEQALAAAARVGHHVGVIFIDLDYFKSINDNFGHDVGDELLKIVATRFSECVHSDDTVGRMGGDEFTILMPDIKHTGEVVDRAQRLLGALSQPITLQGRQLFVSASIGISLYPMDGTDAQTLLKHADIAMYRVKESTGNGYELFTASMNMEALERSMLQNSLRSALERGEFELYYQPQYDLRSSALVGAEALVRWKHPELGLVSPDKFIPLAEETGLILLLGDWVLRTACRQAAQWNSMGQGLHIAVNVSANQLKSATFVASVDAALSAAGLPADLLTIELTESALVESGGDAMQALSQLRDLGVSISVDDFGTGYSSLAYLSRLPLDDLKVDKSFVQGALENARDMSVVKAVIELAHTLGLSVIAEGVEYEEQRACLAALGCDMVQGFLHSRPVPVHVFNTILSSVTT